MGDWKKQYPGIALSREYDQSDTYADRFRGEANKLLYELKNLMKFRNLGQLKMTRFFTDGTVIVARSVFGHDFIEILPGGVYGGQIGAVPGCTVTLYDLPDSVQPMAWYSEGIHTFDDGTVEVEGVDYIKTYYSITTESCADCVLDFSICTTQELATTYGWTAPQTCKPFVFEDDEYPVNDVYENDHCLYGTCQGEIIGFGADSGGTYFLWKAYTEWSTLGPQYATFKRHGLGYFLLRAFIRSSDQELCESDQAIIAVDCCRKALTNRPTNLFWQKCDLEGDWCPAPDSAPATDLMFFWSMGGWNVMTLMTHSPSSQQFGCLPYTWQLVGKGELTVYDDTSTAVYRVPTIDLMKDCGSIAITVQDRCGSNDELVFRSCCADTEGLGILYTSLSMSCGEQQVFVAGGGCPPYHWSATGGTIEADEVGTTALYTTPEANPGCNTSISVSDCCGNSADLQLSVNCYEGDDVAYHVVTFEKANPDISCGTVAFCGLGNAYCEGEGLGDGWQCVCDYVKKKFKYRCDGTSLGLETMNNYQRECGVLGANCPDACSAAPGDNYWPDGCTPVYEAGYCDEAVDDRTQELVDASCCPLNPETGLPF